jgi:molecular chaperone HscB
MNYFELFELPISPIVDKALLSKKYFTLQRKFHPDFFSEASEFEREDALDQSAAVNKAYLIFKDDQKTIEYFLKIKGLISDDEKFQLSNSFLMDMMDFNEELETMEPGIATEKVRQLESELFENTKVKMVQNPENISDSEMLELKEFYFKKKYLQRILDRLAD